MDLKSKGQVTLFVILGLVVFLMIFITIYLIFQEEQEVVDDEVVVIDDARLNPLVDQVEYCLGLLAREALEDIGLRGGFMDVDRDNYVLGVEPGYINNALELFEGSDLVLPYWYGIQDTPDCEDCDFYVNRPVLDGPTRSSISGQVESYVDSNLVSCTDIDLFSDSLEIEHGSPSSFVEFMDDVSVVSVYWPMNVSILGEDVSYEMDSFENDLDIPMRDIYGIASSVLTNAIMADGLLDEFAIDVSDHMASGGRDGEVPPRSGGTDYDFSAPSMWRTSEVSEIMQEAVVENAPYLQIMGSRDSFMAFNTGDPFLDSFLGGMTGSIPSQSSLEDVRIRFDHISDWPFFLRVNPSSGELIMPTSQSVPMLSFVPLTYTNYDFTYDLSFPVLVTLEHDSAFGGDGYLFQFVAEANSRYSQRYAEDVEILEDDSDVTSFADPVNRNIPVEVKVYNAVTQAPMEDVTVSYTCLEETIILGDSEIRDGESFVESELSTCMNGYFSVQGQEHHSDRYYETIMEGEDYNLEIPVYELFDVTIRSEKRLLSVSERDDEGTILNTSISSGTYIPENNEDVNIFLIRDDGEFVRSVTLTGGSEDEVDLLPGYYDVMVLANIYKEENFTTVDEEVCWDEQPWWPFSGEECETIEGVDLGRELVSGHLDMSGDNAIYLSPDELASGYLRFVYPSIEYSDIRTTRDLDLIGNVFQINNHRDFEEDPTLFGLVRDED